MSILAFLVSFLASTAGAICGIGGGVIIKPTLDLFQMTSVSTISFLSGCTVLSMSLYSVGRGLLAHDSTVDFKTGTPLALGAAIGGVFGKQLFTAVKEAASKNKQLEEEVSQLREVTRSKSLSSALAEAGYPESVAKFVPSDVEVDGLAEWLKDNGSLFARAGAAPSNEESSVPADVVRDAQRQASLAENGIPPQKADELMQRIQTAESPEAIDQLLKEARQFVL